MADSIVVLTLLSVCVTWFFISEYQLISEMRHAKEEIKIARIAKEATDEYELKHSDINIIRENYRVNVNKHGVRVMSGSKLKLVINKK
ncbi:hypothetical protein ABTQ33_08525 [Paucilactobacillus suebicus]|uniref:Uncharacterized protein n=1 Tax=Paucilactobacillus suebicus DSM 5007 = KCTC 3549 TaxID=1423807 RepID=A0A0R1VUZ8_9LACO|nr:hypothetical protein [Paucilactobacillus suebicus]KRM09261.1 hypothetical protein FD16_GL001885 [Paucilactobacillus suebicus DSM 5007 = KCTC 3549]